jgi:hypothetical protein
MRKKKEFQRDANVSIARPVKQDAQPSLVGLASTVETRKQLNGVTALET